MGTQLGYKKSALFQNGYLFCILQFGQSCSYGWQRVKGLRQASRAALAAVMTRSASTMKAATMLDLNESYLTRESEARAAAGEEVLENVRQKHLTAAASWAALAHTARKIAELRARGRVERSAAI